MKNLIYTIALGIISLNVLFANDIETAKEAFTKGNEAYKMGEFEQALEHYKTAKTYTEGFTIHYNLGNTYYKLNRFPESILHYEKALKFKPRNKDVLYNLALANSHIPDKIEGAFQSKIELWWLEMKYAPGPDGWGIVSLVFGVLIVLFLILLLTTSSRNTRRLSLYTALVFIVFMIISINFANQAEKYQTTPVSGIIFADKVDVKSEPIDNATRVFMLHAGTKIQLLATEDNWYKIQLADGKEGWIKSENIEEI